MAQMVKEAVDKVLQQQAEKGIKRWEIAISLFSKGFTEGQVGLIMGFNPKTAHAMKIDFGNGKVKREIKNYLKLDVIRMQGFIMNCKVLVGDPAHMKEKRTKDEGAKHR